MTIESILKQFEFVEYSIKRAKLIFEADMLHSNTVPVSIYELLKADTQIENMLNEIVDYCIANKVQLDDNIREEIRKLINK